MRSTEKGKKGDKCIKENRRLIQQGDDKGERKRTMWLAKGIEQGNPVKNGGMRQLF